MVLLQYCKAILDLNYLIRRRLPETLELSHLAGVAFLTFVKVFYLLLEGLYFLIEHFDLMVFALELAFKIDLDKSDLFVLQLIPLIHVFLIIILTNFVYLTFKNLLRVDILLSSFVKLGDFLLFT